MKSSLLALSLATGVLLAGLAAPGHAAGDAAPARMIAMTGSGEISGVPDLAAISLGVISEGETAGAALSSNTEAMTAVTETVKALGIAERDIQTEQFSVNPKYHYPKRSSGDGQQPPKIIGYTVSNTINVRVRDLAALGAALDRIVSAGSNHINGIMFSIDNAKPLEDEARKRAVHDAVAKAELYAKAAGVKLGKLISIREQSSGPAPQFDMVRSRMMAQEAASPVPIERGEQTIRVQVHMSWEIE